MIIRIGVYNGGIGEDLEYFDLYSNNDITPFKEDVTKSELLDGLQVIAPNGTTQVIIKAKGFPCGDNIVITIPVVIAPTTTTSTTTTSTTTSTCRCRASSSRWCNNNRYHYHQILHFLNLNHQRLHQ